MEALSMGRSVVVSLALVFAGGGVGAVLRYGVMAACARVGGVGSGWASAVGTLAVNAVGSLVIGVVAAMLAGGPVEGSKPGGEWVRLLVIVGVLGGFTTFSAFSLESVRLMQAGRVWPAVGFAAGMNAVSIGLAAIGWWVGSLGVGR